MEAVEPEEVFYELQNLQRAQHPSFALQLPLQTPFRVEPVDVPLLAQVLVSTYASRRGGRLLTQVHADTLLGRRCHCYVKTQCVCTQARWFIIRCWLMYASRAEVWRVAHSLATEYAQMVVQSP